MYGSILIVTMPPLVQVLRTKSALLGRGVGTFSGVLDPGLGWGRGKLIVLNYSDSVHVLIDIVYWPVCNVF